VSDVRPYSVMVVLIEGDSSALLSVVSTLHRRGVDVLEAELTRPSAGRRAFTATFLATWKQAGTVEASLRNLVHVVHVELTQPAPVTHAAHRLAAEVATPIRCGPMPDRSRPGRSPRRSGPMAG
jgi:hypothetical protein